MVVRPLSLDRQSVQDRATARWTGIVSALACLTIALVHTGACWRLLGGWEGLHSPLPYLNDDHTFNFYYAVTSRAFLRQSGTTAGYDPRFMAGYAKSILYPSSATLPEVVVFLFGGDRPERAFKAYVMLVAGSLPWLMWIAAAIWYGQTVKDDSTAALRAVGIPMAMALFELFFWTDFGAAYLVYGMVPFVLSAPLTLLASVVAVRFLQQGRWPAWLASVLLISFACLTHISSAFVMLPGLVAAYVTLAPTFTWKRHSAVWTIPVAVLACNAFWLFPGIRLLDTLGTTETGIGFINPNVWERIVEFFVRQPPVELTTVLLAPVGLAIWFRRWRAGFWVLATVIVWTFFLGYVAGLFRRLDAIQPGRYTLYFFTWGALPAALGAGWLMQVCFNLLHRMSLVLMLAFLLAAGSVWTYGPGLHVTLLPLLSRDTGPKLAQRIMPTTLPPLHVELFEQLKANVQPGDRVLFEESNHGIELNGTKVPDPMGNLRLAPLVPLETGAEVIGGPYLYTHLKTNFTQFGDGLLMGRPRWSRREFEQYAAVYNVRWIVCWSPYAVSFCRAQPDLIDVLPTGRSPFLIGKIALESVRATARAAGLRGTAAVSATPGTLVVTDSRPEDGLLVIPYHWTPHLTSTPAVRIEPIRVLDDPVPLIGLRDPPDQMELRIDLLGR